MTTTVGARRAFWVTYALATVTALVVLVLATSAANRERETDVEVTATVLDGRGTSGDDAELLLRIPVPAGATVDDSTVGAGGDGDGVERWVATDEFGDETVGSPIEVHVPAGDVDEAHLARDCTCGPITAGDLWQVGLLLAMPAAGMATLGWQRRRAASVLASSPDRQPVRVWWAGGATGTLVVFDRDDRPLGSVLVAPSTRAALPDGSAATLVGEPGPRSPVALETDVGPILPTSTLRPVSADLVKASARTPLGLRRRRSVQVGTSTSEGGTGRQRVLRVPAPATAGSGVAIGLLPLVLLGVVAPLAPSPWRALCLGLAGAAVAVGVAVGVDARRRSRAATAVARAAAASAPPMPSLAPEGASLAGARNGAELVLGGDRPLEAPGRFLGFALTLAAVSFVWFFLVILYWPLTALVLVDGALLVARSPRPVRGRIVRPALPLLAATAVATAGSWAWLAGISTDDWNLPMAIRVPLVVASIPLALLAWRMVTVGVTVGQARWYVRNVVRRARFDAADVVAVRVGDRQRSDQGAERRARPGGLVIDLADGRTVRASRFTVSRRSARRLVDQLEADGVPRVASVEPLDRPASAPAGPAEAPTNDEGSLVTAAERGPYWRG